jgi:uncharacterized membrane protein
MMDLALTEGSLQSVSMERDHRPLYLWLLCIVADALMTAYYWPRLPQVLAQHFGAAGNPNGWAPKQDFFLFMWGIIALMAAIFFLMAALMRRLPFSFLNIPHKDYWSAPERRPLAFNILEAQMNWMGAAVTLLLTLVFQMVLATNASGMPRLNNVSFIAILAVFGTFTTVWLIRLFTRFKPPATP